MEIYDHPTFRMACQQFDLVADHLEIPTPERDRLQFPKRSSVIIPMLAFEAPRTRGISLEQRDGHS